MLFSVSVLLNHLGAVFIYRVNLRVVRLVCALGALSPVGRRAASRVANLLRRRRRRAGAPAPPPARGNWRRRAAVAPRGSGSGGGGGATLKAASGTANLPPLATMTQHYKSAP